MSDIAEKYRQFPAQMKKTQQLGALKAFSAFHQAVIQDGAVDAKTKELIALGIGLAVRCEGCILHHTAAAMKFGATREELLEVGEVVVMMQGGPGVMHIPTLIDCIDAVEAMGKG